MTRKVVDLAGRKFGRLTVTSFARMAGAYSMWRCSCDCGKRKEVRGSNLTAGATVSCGCARIGPNKDLTGQKIGFVEVVKLIEAKKKDSIWLCKCECGTSFSAKGTYLRSTKHGTNKSCGCHHAAMARRNGANAKSTHGFASNFERPPEYSIWGVAKNKAKNKGTICAPEFDGFEGFLAAVGERPSREHRLVRLDPPLGFVKGNLEWKHFPPYAPRGSRPKPEPAPREHPELLVL